MGDAGERPGEGDGTTYPEAAERFIDQAMNYMGEHRALQVASSVPIRIDSEGNVQGMGASTQDSERDVVELLLEVYVEVVGRQLVVNMLEAAVSGELLHELKNLCPPQGGTGTSSTGRVQA